MCFGEETGGDLDVEGERRGRDLVRKGKGCGTAWALDGVIVNHKMCDFPSIFCCCLFMNFFPDAELLKVI